MDKNNQSPDPLTLCVLHFADHNGRVQIIFPRHRILDIGQVSKITNRHFKPIYPVSPQNQDRFNLSRQTIVDSYIFNYDTARVLSPYGEDYVELETKEIQKSFAGPLNYFEPISINTEQVPKIVKDHRQDEEQMKLALGRFQSIRIKQRLHETLEMPALSNSAQRIIQLSTKDKADAEELCDIISLDPSLAAQVMAWASSPYYGTRNDVSSIKDAIVRVVGYDLVLNLSLGLSLSNCVSPPKHGPRPYQDFWLNAVSQAFLMECLAREMPTSNSHFIGHAYLVGLLHNFGYLVMGTVLSPYFNLLSRSQEANRHQPTELIEMHTLHFTQEQIASWQLQHWGLPEDVCLAIRYSKDQAYQGEHEQLARLMFVAQTLYKGETITEEQLKPLGLEQERVQACYHQLMTSKTLLRQLAKLIKKPS
ncbi:HDOD domain-containing protein [Marinomonas epiphytica]